MDKYYPLELSAKFRHKSYGYIPSKTFKRKTRKELLSYSQNWKNFSFEGILKTIYTNFYHYRNQESRECPDIIYFICKIIPMDYFGSVHNRKRFLYIVKRILTQSRGEYVHVCLLVKPFNHCNFPWLNRREDLESQVFDANILLLQTVVKPFIRHFYHYLNSFRTREFRVVIRSKLDSFFDRNIAVAIKTCYMKKLTSMRPPRARGTLSFLPKKSVLQLDHRPILRSFETNSNALESIRKNLKNLIKTYQLGKEANLYEKWKIFIQHTKCRKKLYAIKLDLFNAFGMIDIEILKTIIRSDSQFLTVQQKDFLIQSISQQYVKVRGNIYQWYNGLLQGAKLSPTLCELYLSYTAHNHLADFDKPNNFFHRTVDDIFFISTSEMQVNDFELAAFKAFLLNEEKTHKFTTVDHDPNIVFCGKNFNLETRETSNAYDFKPGKDLRGNFKFWNRKMQFGEGQTYEYLINIMKFAYVNYHFSRFELNTACNQVETVIKNLFHAMCYLGFKLFYAIESIEYLFKTVEERCEISFRVVEYITTNYAQIIRRTIRRYRGEFYKNIFSINLINFICLKAFILVFQRRHFKYKIFIAKMKARDMYIPGLKSYINLKYFRKLPLTFENIKMQRTVQVDTS